MSTNQGFMNRNNNISQVSVSKSLHILNEVRSLELTSCYFAQLIGRLDERDTLIDALTLYFLVYSQYSTLFPLIDRQKFTEFLYLFQGLAILSLISRPNIISYYIDNL